MKLLKNTIRKNRCKTTTTIRISPLLPNKALIRPIKTNNNGIIKWKSKINSGANTKRRIVKNKISKEKYV